MKKLLGTMKHERDALVVVPIPVQEKSTIAAKLFNLGNDKQERRMTFQLVVLVTLLLVSMLTAHVVMVQFFYQSSRANDDASTVNLSEQPSLSSPTSFTPPELSGHLQPSVHELHPSLDKVPTTLVDERGNRFWWPFSTSAFQKGMLKKSIFTQDDFVFWDSNLFNLTYLQDVLHFSDHVRLWVPTHVVSAFPRESIEINSFRSIPSWTLVSIPTTILMQKFQDISKRMRVLVNNSFSSNGEVKPVHILVDDIVTVQLNDAVPMVKNETTWNVTLMTMGLQPSSLNLSAIKVAVLDTGIDLTHPDFQGLNIAGTESFVPTEPNVTDYHGHGTHVASIIAGTGAASNGTYRGIASGVQLYVGKVLGAEGYGYTSWITEGIEWAVNNSVDIISMSLGTSSPSDGTDPLSQTVDWATRQNVTVVVAAGNSWGRNIGAPAAARGAITVGAVDKNGLLADFSSRGPTVDGRLKPEVAAPGVDIIAARASNTSMGTPINAYYTKASGTSMATPLVAGAVAWYLTVHPQATPLQVKQSFMTTGWVPNPNSANIFGYGGGIANVSAAIAANAHFNGSYLNFGNVIDGNSSTIPMPQLFTFDGSNLHVTNLTWLNTNASTHAISLNDTTVTLNILTNNISGDVMGYLYYQDPTALVPWVRQNIPYTFQRFPEINVTVILNGSLFSSSKFDGFVQILPIDNDRFMPKPELKRINSSIFSRSRLKIAMGTYVITTYLYDDFSNIHDRMTYITMYNKLSINAIRRESFTFVISDTQLNRSFINLSSLATVEELKHENTYVRMELTTDTTVATNATYQWHRVVTVGKQVSNYEAEIYYGFFDNLSILDFKALVSIYSSPLEDPVMDHSMTFQNLHLIAVDNGPQNKTLPVYWEPPLASLYKAHIITTTSNLSTITPGLAGRMHVPGGMFIQAVPAVAAGLNVTLTWNVPSFSVVPIIFNHTFTWNPYYGSSWSANGNRVYLNNSYAGSTIPIGTKDIDFLNESISLVGNHTVTHDQSSLFSKRFRFIRFLANRSSTVPLVIQPLTFMAWDANKTTKLFPAFFESFSNGTSLFHVRVNVSLLFPNLGLHQVVLTSWFIPNLEIVLFFNVTDIPPTVVWENLPQQSVINNYIKLNVTASEPVFIQANITYNVFHQTNNVNSSNGTGSSEIRQYQGSKILDYIDAGNTPSNMTVSLIVTDGTHELTFWDSVVVDDGAPPTITNVTIQPTQLALGDNITIHARINDGSLVDHAEFFFSIPGFQQQGQMNRVNASGPNDHLYESVFNLTSLNVIDGQASVVIPANVTISAMDIVGFSSSLTIQVNLTIQVQPSATSTTTSTTSSSSSTTSTSSTTTSSSSTTTSSTSTSSTTTSSTSTSSTTTSSAGNGSTGTSSTSNRSSGTTSSSASTVPSTITSTPTPGFSFLLIMLVTMALALFRRVHSGQRRRKRPPSASSLSTS